MADETSKSGFDDILSSVRRIVSTEVDAAADAASGKLLLTPALRVNDPEPKQPTEDRDFPTLEERIADLEEAVGSEETEWEPDGSEDLDQHKPDAVVLPLRPGDRSEPDSDALQGVGTPGDSAERSEDPSNAVLDVGAPEDGIDEAIAPDLDPSLTEPATEDQPASSDDENSEDPDLGTSERDDTAGVSNVAEKNVEDEDGAAPSPEDIQDDEIEAAAFAETSAELTADVGDTPLAPEVTAAPSTIVEPTVAPLATFKHRTHDAPDAGDLFVEEDTALLDESALRELVAEIVREELQGGLGERITRNVRKLVRAEIQRAFAARDLD